MRQEDVRRMYELCALIEKEKDHIKYRQLIKELTEILEGSQTRVENTTTD